MPPRTPTSAVERLRHRLRSSPDAARLRRGALDRFGPALRLRPAFHGDIARLVRITDRVWWDGLLEGALRERGLDLSGEWSGRLTSSAGNATVAGGRAVVRISHVIVAATEGGGRWPVPLQGLPCPDTPTLVQLIVEHELAHLAEYASCGSMRGHGAGFRAIAGGQFGHTEHTHTLTTSRARAADAGIRPGARVTFVHRGVRRRGLVVRIRKRATVLTEGPARQKWYVPLHELAPAPE